MTDWADKKARELLDDPENFIRDPIAGPIPIHFNAFYGKLAQALRDERERCAVIATKTQRSGFGGGAYNEAGLDIAAAIRDTQ